MLVWVINTNAGDVYPPYGLRVSVHETWRELAQDVHDFFWEAEDQRPTQLYTLGGALMVLNDPTIELYPGERVPTDADLQKWIVKSVRYCAGERSWSIFDSDSGYIDKEPVKDRE